MTLFSAFRHSIYLIFICLFIVAPSHLCQAGWELLPESHHQLYDAWGNFVDQQASLLNYGQARLWTGLGGTIPIFGDSDSEHSPTIVIHASANAGLHYNDNFRIWTETLDVRLGFAFEWEFNDQLRFSIGLTHNSAHTADGISEFDLDLVEPSVGQEFIPVRIVYDLDKQFRIAATLKPFIRSYPSVHAIWFDQSVEYFPWGALDLSHRLSPYIALGLDESGMADYSYKITYHAQIGAYVGNHFSKTHHQTIRTVLGYYSGYDPRLKYFELKNASQQFAYLGVMFDL